MPTDDVTPDEAYAAWLRTDEDGAKYSSYHGWLAALAYAAGEIRTFTYLYTVMGEIEVDAFRGLADRLSPPRTT